METVERLASYRRCAERIDGGWQQFRAQRLERLRERDRFGHAAERATESIIEDLFCGLLDWTIGDLNHQVGYADILLSRLGIKYLIIEAKHPGALAWNRRAVGAALEQACRYAAEQKVKSVAVTDGVMLYAADVTNGGLRDRVFCSLEHPKPQQALWWLSIDGIYRPCTSTTDALAPPLPHAPPDHAKTSDAVDQLLHPKYRLPARCFAYVGNAADVHTWHLPYLNADGITDTRRLPKAVQAILTNYRGAHLALTSVPECDVPDVLIRLACAAASLGKLPHQTADPAPVYLKLIAAIDQLNRLDEIPG